MYLQVYFWLHWVFVAVRKLFSSCGERGLRFIVVHRLLIAVASLVAEHDFSCCRAWPPGARASVVVARGLSSCGLQAQQFWRTGLVAPRHVGSSWTRARTRVSCTGRQILNHCATREALFLFFIYFLNIYLFVYLVAPGLSCGRRAPQLWRVNSQLQHACGIQFPDQGSNPGPMHWEHRVLTTVPPGKSPNRGFMTIYYRKDFTLEWLGQFSQMILKVFPHYDAIL